MASEINSSLKNVAQDLNEIYGRLFDHHPFVSGEINYFLKEFEGKRREDDVEGLFQILDRVVDTRETQLDKAVNLAEPDLQIVKDNLITALQNCEKILNKESIVEAEVAALRRMSLQKEWEVIETDYAAKQEEITNLFNEKEQEIKNYYTELEKKLHIDK